MGIGLFRSMVVLAGLVASVVVVLPAGAAQGGSCEVVGADTVCTFEFTGVEQTFVVPASVTSVRVLAQGAAGAPGPHEAPGGRGATVTGELSVRGGQTLYVQVGGPPTGGPKPTGGNCRTATRCNGGFNGGGSSPFYSGGGGGASDVRTVSAAADGSLASRRIVAAGGGGGGTRGVCESHSSIRGAGGDAGAAGEPGGACPSVAGGTGGGAGTSSAGGAGGVPGGSPGSLGAGGNGADDTGGGGGGGLYGGGGGGAEVPNFAIEERSGAGGGGGGSSLGTLGGLADVSKVVITYTLPAPKLSTVTPSLLTLGGQSADSATVEGLVRPVAGSSVDFRLYGPDDGDCSDSPVYQSLDRPLSLAGATGSATSETFTPTKPGTYRWIASFSGDENNAPAAGACDDAKESVIVLKPGEQPPAGSTAALCPTGTSATVRCERDAKGRLAMTGTEADETFIGTSGRDRISPHGGDDTVHGNGGKDLISGGAGGDELHGGAGNDRMNGNAGNDRVSGDSGHDSISGEAGSDRISGQGGNDSASGGPGADSMSGGDGADRIRGLGADDRLLGGPGADMLSGGGGDDDLTGGPSPDKLRCGPGTDTIHDAAADDVGTSCEG